MAKLKCDICGRSTKKMVGKTSYGKPLCREHDNQYNKYGKFLKWNIHNENEYIKYNDRCEIILRNIKMEEVGRAIIDIDDFTEVIKHKWRLNNGYASCISLRKQLHLLIYGEHNGQYIDHISRNRLDCRKVNLRSVSGSLNGFNKGKQSNNTSNHVGVSWDKSHSKWESHIKQNRKKKFLGYYDNIDDAIESRKLAEMRYYGEIIDRSNDKYTIFK